MPKEPFTHLKKGSAKNVDLIWVPSNGADTGPEQPKYALAHYRVGHGVVVSHDCAIDKPNRTTRFALAPLQPLSSMSDAKIQEQIRIQAHLALMYLPSNGFIPDSFVDLRLTSPFPRDMVVSFTRVASLSDEARERLQTAIVAFYVSRDRNTKLP